MKKKKIKEKACLARHARSAHPLAKQAAPCGEAARNSYKKALRNVVKQSANALALRQAFLWGLRVAARHFFEGLPAPCGAGGPLASQAGFASRRLTAGLFLFLFRYGYSI